MVEQLTKEPELLSVELLRRARLQGYKGGKTALYELVHSIRPKPVRLMTRFEGLPGEFTQHDFGHVDVPVRRTTSQASRGTWRQGAPYCPRAGTRGARD